MTAWPGSSSTGSSTTVRPRSSNACTAKRATKYSPGLQPAAKLIGNGDRLGQQHRDIRMQIRQGLVQGEQLRGMTPRQLGEPRIGDLPWSLQLLVGNMPITESVV